MKRLTLILCALFTFLACGAPAEEFDDLELGELEQAFSARPFYGVRSDEGAPSEGGQCQSPTTGLDTQVCNYPNDRVVSFRCGPLFTAAERMLCAQFVDAEVLSLTDQFGDAGWAFQRVTDGGDVVFQKLALGGVSTTSIRPYVNLAGSFTAAAPEAASYRGSHRRFSALTISVDWAKVDANFAGAANTRVKAHTIQNGTSWAVGLGYNTTDNTRKNSSTITSGAAKAFDYTTADQCRVNAYDPSGATITIGGAC